MRRSLKAGRLYKHRQYDAHDEQRRNVSQQMTHVVSAGTERLDRHDRGVHEARNRGEPDEAEMGLRVSRSFEEEDA